MSARLAPLFFVLALVGCERAHVEAIDAAKPPVASPSSAPSIDAGASATRLPDDAVGPLLAKLSESPGDFPSDNYVSNETSLLHVAAALRNPALKGRAYVGVGPEQNFTYLALLDPAIAYVVDIRRGNLLELMVFRGCFEAGKTRAEFLRALLARRGEPVEGAGFAPLAAAFGKAVPDRTLRDEGLARTLALLDRLHVVREKGDENAVARIHDAFFTKGLALAYTMKNSVRTYPTFAENMAMKDDAGVEASFLASEDAYARVRTMFVDNRVLPIVGDFGGKHALMAVADDMRTRGLGLGVFYTSNVEQYLFESHTYPSFVASVAAMPRDGESLIVRVWFDQGRPHPAQRAGHRTTQLTMRANAFVARAEKKPFASYWDVTNP